MEFLGSHCSGVCQLRWNYSPAYIHVKQTEAWKFPAVQRGEFKVLICREVYHDILLGISCEGSWFLEG